MNHRNVNTDGRAYIGGKVTVGGRAYPLDKVESSGVIRVDELPIERRVAVTKEILSSDFVGGTMTIGETHFRLKQPIERRNGQYVYERVEG